MLSKIHYSYADDPPQIYAGPSDMFKAHVDTPRSQNQFGSLVVCLPCPHEGSTSDFHSITPKMLTTVDGDTRWGAGRPTQWPERRVQLGRRKSHCYTVGGLL